MRCHCIAWRLRIRSRSIGVGKAAQVDDMHFSIECVGNRMTGNHGDHGLADPAGTKHSDELPLLNPSKNRRDHRFAVDQHRRSRGGPAAEIAAAAAVLAIFTSDDRADEAIASSLDVCDVSIAELTVPERLADGGDMDAQTYLLYGNARPDVIDEFFLWDDFAGALRQIYENIERPVAEGNLHALAPEHPISSRQLKWSELEFAVRITGHHSAHDGYRAPGSRLPPIRPRDDNSRPIRTDTIGSHAGHAKIRDGLMP